jgi:hypothetical protein
MIDASKGFIKDGNKNRLREQDLHKIVDAFNKQWEIVKYSRLVPFKEIEKKIEEEKIYKEPKVKETPENDPHPQPKPRKIKNISLEELITDAKMISSENDLDDLFAELKIKLKKYTKRTNLNSGGIKVNFLVNYGWQWDLKQLSNTNQIYRNKIINFINSYNISLVDMIIRWGGRRRLSGFLPVQSIYADFYVIKDYWPDFKAKHFYNALKWYDKQDLTYGG